MIEQIQGILIRKTPTLAVVDCQGVGYGLQISTRTSETLPEVGHQIQLFTYLHVREDALQLFGFSCLMDRDLFLAMIGISGIGPKLAQRILSEVSGADFMNRIAQQDHAALSRIKGIGKKTADLLILSLRDKAGILVEDSGAAASGSSGAETEAILALEALGVKAIVARKAVEKAVKILGDTQETSRIIAEALKHS